MDRIPQVHVVLGFPSLFFFKSVSVVSSSNISSGNCVSFRLAESRSLYTTAVFRKGEAKLLIAL